MKIIRFPRKEDWSYIAERPCLDVSQLNTIVSSVLNDVRQNGDMAVIKYERKFDHVELESLSVTDNEMIEAERIVSPELHLNSATLFFLLIIILYLFMSLSALQVAKLKHSQG